MFPEFACETIGTIKNIQKIVFSFPMALYGRIHGIDEMLKYINTPLYFKEFSSQSTYVCISHIEKYAPGFVFLGKIRDESDVITIGNEIIIDDDKDFGTLIGKHIVPQ